MRTTVNIDDALLRAAKKRAAEEDRTLTSVLEEALRAHLLPRPAAVKPYKFKPLVKRGGSWPPPVDVVDRKALYDFFDANP